jgi:shikimate kinase
MKIFLIGLPGSGKTTLGKSLASLLKTEFVDLDEQIAKQEQQPVPEIFQLKGEDYFRMVESKILHQWASQNQSFVMATGGGAPCFHNGMEVMNAVGKTIYLNVPTEELINRLKNTAGRPLLQGDVEKKLELLTAQREPVYQRAKITLYGPSITAQHLYRKLTHELW